jgi:hypothetical protein
MSDLEFTLKECLGELKDTVKELGRVVNDLKTSSVTRADCAVCKTENTTKNSQYTNWLIGAYMYITTGIGIIIAILENK